MVEWTEDLKKEAEEETKSEAEEKELGRRVGELEEDFKKVEEVKRKIGDMRDD